MMVPTSGGRITRIEPQKKNPKRFSIFIDNEFALGVNEELLLKFNLSQGVHLSRQELEVIEREETFRQAKEAALRSLSRTPKSTREISRRLKDWGFEEQVIGEVVCELEKYGYLNDREFARIYSESCLRTNPLGPRLLSQKLFTKGLSRELIQQTIEETYRQHDEVTLAKKLLAKRRDTYEAVDSRIARKRKADYLARRGFSWDAIREALDVKEDE
jgi:regulatory protein